MMVHVSFSALSCIGLALLLGRGEQSPQIGYTGRNAVGCRRTAFVCHVACPALQKEQASAPVHGRKS